MLMSGRGGRPGTSNTVVLRLIYRRWLVIAVSVFTMLTSDI